MAHAPTNGVNSDKIDLFNMLSLSNARSVYVCVSEEGWGGMLRHRTRPFLTKASSEIDFILPSTKRMWSLFFIFKFP